jgi:hypothetical protein
VRTLLTCLVMLVAAAAVRAGSKEDLATVDIRSLTKAIEFYKTKCGNFPVELADLKTAGYVDPKTTFLDPWGNPYQYDAKGKHNGGKRPDVWAVTPDKKEIGNWEGNEKK